MFLKQIIKLMLYKTNSDNFMHIQTEACNRRQEKLLNIQLLPGDADFPKRKQKQVKYKP